MTSPRFLMSVAFLVALFATLAPMATQAEENPMATGAAQTWLQLVDSGDYGTSWDQAASYFRNGITKAEWEKNMNAFRTPLGSVISRQMLIAREVTKLPGAPDGVYLVVEFESAFVNKAKALETVTVLLEATGAWRVAGYYFR